MADKPIKVGFIVGKDTDVVEDPKYISLGGDVSFLKDLPDDWRVDPESNEYLKDCDEGTKGFAHADVAIAFWIFQHCQDIAVDIIGPDDITVGRLRQNDVNFSLGFNAVNLLVSEDPTMHKKMKALETCGNIAPDWDFEQFILKKSNYMTACVANGVPMAPTIFADAADRSPESLLSQIKARGWKSFVMKQSCSGFSLGFMKLNVSDCEKDLSVLEQYFEDYESCPEFVVQETVEGFTRNWETRCFWYNGEFLYAIANMAAVSSEDGAERIISGDDIPKEFLENAKRIGAEAIKCLPDLKVPGGETCPMVLVRTDIGCSDGEINDKDYNWKAGERTFFLNEIEPSSTTYFVRHLKFDSIPMYGRLYAATARKMKAKMEVAQFVAEHHRGKAKEMTPSKAKAKAKGKAKGQGKAKAKAVMKPGKRA